jgi:Uma2 family endonuclease
MATDVEHVVNTSGAVVLRDITWGTYLTLRDNTANDSVRMTYLDGTLYLMSPEFIHEHGVGLLGLFIRSVTKALGQEIKGIGSTTLQHGPRRRGKRGAGKEPDCAFYLGENERRMRKAKSLDLESDPPPDLAIEVDNKADSTAARPVYARIGVPEVWRYAPGEETSLVFYRLVEEDYEEVGRSVCLPILTPALVLEGLDMAESEDVGENAWMDLIVEWARALPAPPPAP